MMLGGRQGINDRDEGYSSNSLMTDSNFGHSIVQISVTPGANTPKETKASLAPKLFLVENVDLNTRGTLLSAREVSTPIVHDQNKAD